jgi:hypothetical protein
VGINDLRVGDCFDDATPEGQEIDEVDGKPCSEPHEYELFHIATWTGGDTYPSDADMEQFIMSECFPAFEAFVGIPYEESDFFLFWTSPTEEAWNAGDRVFQCALYDPDDPQLTASVRGSNR